MGVLFQIGSELSIYVQKLGSGAFDCKILCQILLFRLKLRVHFHLKNEKNEINAPEPKKLWNTWIIIINVGLYSIFRPPRVILFDLIGNTCWPCFTFFLNIYADPRMIFANTGKESKFPPLNIEIQYLFYVKKMH